MKIRQTANRMTYLNGVSYFKKFHFQSNKLSTSTWTRGQKTLLTAVGALAGGAGALVLALDHSVKAFDLVLHPPELPWSHKGFFNALDHAR